MSNQAGYMSVPNSNVTLAGQFIDYNVDNSSTAKIYRYTDRGYNIFKENVGISIWTNDYELENLTFGTDEILVGYEKNVAKPSILVWKKMLRQRLCLLTCKVPWPTIIM